MKISVIIPVYNAGKYIAHCLESILKQTLQSFEIICVDDGSEDGTLSILYEYQKHDDRIQIYRQNRLSAGAARNKGIEKAAGEYLVFVDADDFIESTYLECLYKRCSESDAQVCFCHSDQFDDRSHEYRELVTMIPEHLPQKEVFAAAELEDSLFYCMIPSPWAKMIRRDFILKNNIRFQELHHANDLYFSKMVLALADKAAVLQGRALYHYRVNMTDNLQSDCEKFCFDDIKALLFLRDGLTARAMYSGTVKRSFINFFMFHMIWYMKKIKEKEEILLPVFFWMQQEGIQIVEKQNYLNPGNLYAYQRIRAWKGDKTACPEVRELIEQLDFVKLPLRKRMYYWIYALSLYGVRDAVKYIRKGIRQRKRRG